MATIESLKAIIEPLRGSIQLQTIQLQQLEKQLWELENPVETRPLSYDEMKKRVIAFEKSATYKKKWKEAIENDLLDNVQRIVDDCYYAWQDKDSCSEKVSKAAKALGRPDSLKWQLFTLKIIERLHNQGSFWSEQDGWFDTYDDTAGGCDELVWDEGCYILNNPE